MIELAIAAITAMWFISHNYPKGASKLVFALSNLMGLIALVAIGWIACLDYVLDHFEANLSQHQALDAFKAIEDMFIPPWMLYTLCVIPLFLYGMLWLPHFLKSAEQNPANPLDQQDG